MDIICDIVWTMEKGTRTISGPVGFLTNKDTGRAFPIGLNDPKAQAALKSPKHIEVMAKIIGQSTGARGGDHRRHVEHFAAIHADEAKGKTPEQFTEHLESKIREHTGKDVQLHDDVKLALREQGEKHGEKRVDNPEQDDPKPRYELSDKNKIMLSFSKQDFDALPEETRGDIRRYYNWSQSTKAWISKATSSDWKAQKIATAAGFAKPDDGKKLKQPEQEQAGIEEVDGLEPGAWHKARSTDLDRDLVVGAFTNLKHSPDRAAEQVMSDYVGNVNDLAETVHHYADTDIKRKRLRLMIEEYRQGLVEKYKSWLLAKAKTASPMITGPANFPVERNQKAMAIENDRAGDIAKYRAVQEAKIRNEIGKGYQSNAADVQKAKKPYDEHKHGYLTSEVARLIAMSDRLKAINKVVNGDSSDEEKMARLVAEMGQDERSARNLLRKDLLGRRGILPSDMAPLNTKIRFYKRELDDMEAPK